LDGCGLEHHLLFLILMVEFNLDIRQYSKLCHIAGIIFKIYCRPVFGMFRRYNNSSPFGLGKLKMI
jgi:hypothetical protein